jgi:hypothetical protein
VPVKRRAEKRRLVKSAQLAAWDGVFDCGYDFFGDLALLGLETNHSRPPEEVIRAAWAMLGRDFLAARAPGAQPCWAEAMFGRPGVCHAD